MPVEVLPCAEHAGVRIVQLSGRIDMADSEPVRKTMADAIDDSEAGIVVDMSELEFISSSGFRALICAQKDSNAANKTMTIVAAHPSVYKIFKVAGLDKVFQFAETQADAIAAMSD